MTAPDGTVPLVEVMESQKPPDPRMRARVISRVRLIVKGDSVSVDEMTAERPADPRSSGSEDGVVPYLNLSFGMLEVGLRQAHDRGEEGYRGWGDTGLLLQSGRRADGACAGCRAWIGNQAMLSIGEIVDEPRDWHPTESSSRSLFLRRG